MSQEDGLQYISGRNNFNESDNTARRRTIYGMAPRGQKQEKEEVEEEEKSEE